jgi:TonB-linked SusC/RagA family outer membrane protein
MIRRVLISGCALALLTSEAMAQETGTTEQAPAAAPAPAPEAPPAAPAPAAPTLRTIRGRAVDKVSNEGVPLVRVIIKGTTQGTETDLEGRFTLQVPPGPVALDISSQDYKQRDVLVGANQTSVTVALEPSFVEELVVVGRASEVARKNLANSVATVNAENLARAPASTVDQAVQGKVAGANIQSNSGAPGGGMQMRLRGVSTINGESAPLYVIDGVLVSDVAIASGIFAVTASTGGSNPNPTQDNQVNRIADINPNDIESIEILKGASAAAIYGSKASNGVVIINTKRGRAGTEPRVDITQRVGLYTLANKIGARRFTSEEEAVAAFGEPAREYFQQGRFFDHEAELASRRDLSAETVASVSGAVNDTRYFGSALIKDDNGIIGNTGYEKQSFRLNVGQKFGDRVDVNVSGNLVHSLSDRGLSNNDNAGVTYHMVLPFTPSFLNLQPDENGNYPQNPFIGSLANPLQTAALVRNDENVWRFIASGDATVNVYKGASSEFKVLANFGVDRFQQQNSVLFPPELHFEPEDDKLAGTSLAGTAEARNLNAGINVVYNLRPAGTGIIANTSAGFSFEERALDTLYVVSRNLTAGQPNVDSGTQVNIRQERSLIRDRGYYVQEEMILLDERLTLVGAVRGEQGSNNADPNKLFLYPKLATAYRIPSFAAAVDEFKVRLAYGETGNQPRYGDKFRPLLANVNIGGNSGIIGSGVTGSPDLHPERQREVEAGLDAIFMGGNIVTELTLYQRNISDLLLRRALAPSTGFQTEIFNGGTMRNRGVEVMVQLSPFSGGEFEWTSNTTFTVNRSKVTELPVPAFLAGGFGTGLGAFRIEEGASATQIVGNAGLKEDGTCCEVRKIGDTEPDFRMGFSNTFRYGGWSLSFLLDWQKGSDVINLTRFIYDLGQNSPDFAAGKTEDRLGAGEQRLKDQATNAGVYVEDASFLKMREISLSYQFPDTWVTRVPKLKSARLSFSARNVFTVSGYSGLDPEVSNFGNQAIARNIDVAPFPPSRSFWTSLDVGF